MDINNRFRGDTNPLIMFLYEVDDAGIETPVPLVASGSSVVFSYRKDSVTKSIQGESLSDLGEVRFPFTDSTVIAGTYDYDVQVTNGAGEVITYVKATMTIQDDVTK